MGAGAKRCANSALLTYYCQKVLTKRYSGLPFWAKCLLSGAYSEFLEQRRSAFLALGSNRAGRGANRQLPGFGYLL
jgi:hypothetical protein